MANFYTLFNSMKSFATELSFDSIRQVFFHLTFSNHGITGKGNVIFKSSLPLPPAQQKLRQLGNYSESSPLHIGIGWT